MTSTKRLKILIIAVLLMAVIYILGIMIPKLLESIYPLKHEDIIKKYAIEYELDLYLIAAIIKVESNYDMFAKSAKGAMGLMQIRPTTGKWIAEQIEMEDFKEEMLYNPETNIKIGCWYLNYLLKYYDGKYELALAAYNGGQGNVDKWLKDKNFSDDGITLKNIPFEETRLYIKKIDRAYNMYKRIYKNTN